MHSETRREIVILLARSVAHLYAIASATAAADEWDEHERAAEILRVLEMMKRAYDQLEPVPECAASVLEQCTIVHGIHASSLDHVQVAMALARSGLVINTWCTAATMLVSAQATDGPLTIGSLMHLLGTMQPDPRYQAALAERLAAVAYDNSALRQLGTCYFQAFEGYSLLELHRLIQLGEPSRAADLLDNASRGALTAVRFLERQPISDEQDQGAPEDDPEDAPDEEGDDAPDGSEHADQVDSPATPDHPDGAVPPDDARPDHEAPGDNAV
jgi:hypothetical protein